MGQVGFWVISPGGIRELSGAYAAELIFPIGKNFFSETGKLISIKIRFSVGVTFLTFQGENAWGLG